MYYCIMSRIFSFEHGAVHDIHHQHHHSSCSALQLGLPDWAGNLTQSGNPEHQHYPKVLQAAKETRIVVGSRAGTTTWPFTPFCMVDYLLSLIISPE